MIFYDIKQAPFDVYGLYNYRNEPEFKRMPDDVAAKVNEGVVKFAKHTSGGRIRFRTNSSQIQVRLTMVNYNTGGAHMTLFCSVGCDLYIKQGTKYVFYGVFAPGDFNKGYTAAVNFPDSQERDVMIHFPLYNDVVTFEIGLEEGATLDHGLKYTYDKPVVYYGSSITQGGCASRPGNAYPALISRQYDCDFINLGMCAAAMGELTMAEYIVSLEEMSVFVMDYDYNAPNAEHLKKTHEPFFRLIRKKRPELPIVLVSKADSDMNDTVHRKEVIYQTYLNALLSGDKNVYFIDGESLYGGENRDGCTVDFNHPNDLGFERMARGIGEIVGKLLKK